MESLSKDATGQKLLAPLAVNGITAAKDKDWNDIRALDIKLLESYGLH
jgi:hypothetical protein